MQGESPVEAGPAAALCGCSGGSPSPGGLGSAEPWNVARFDKGGEGDVESAWAFSAKT